MNLPNVIRTSFLLVTLTFLAGCSVTNGVGSIDSLCAGLGPLQREYTDKDRQDILTAMREFPSVRKPVEQAVGVKELYEASCVKTG